MAVWAGLLASTTVHAADAGTGANEARVHCLFPGKVRRIGAFSSVVTPRRAAQVSVAECHAAGGEYVVRQDPLMAVRQVWLPLAAEGVAEAQLTVGELYEQQGQSALARVWYEKAAAQGVARAQFNLAALTARSGGASDRVHELLAAASGGLVAGLLLGDDTRPRIDVVSPESAVHLPSSAADSSPLTVVVPDPGPHTVRARYVAPAGLASLTANGQPVQPAEPGWVDVTLAAQDAPQELALTLTDRLGQQAQARVSLTHRAASPSTSPGRQTTSAAILDEGSQLLPPGRRHALVVANQGYQHWPALETPRADAQAVSALLRERFGFEVTALHDVTRAQVLQALARLRQSVGPNDQVLLYYAGHGQMDDATARGYWIPVDGGSKDVSGWLSVIDITDQLAAMPARHVLVIADSCYSGTLTRSLMPRVDAALSLAQRRAPLAHLSQQRVRVAMTSGGLEPVVDGGSVEHSLFARSLLDALRGIQAPVAARELFDVVTARFAHLGRRLQVSQTPEYAPMAFAGHEAGDFVLVPHKAD